VYKNNKMTTFNESVDIGHGPTFTEHATDYKLSLNGVSVSAGGSQVVFASGGKSRTLVIGEADNAVCADKDGNVSISGNLTVGKKLKLGKVDI
jgi:hypothetical protein